MRTLLVTFSVPSPPKGTALTGLHLIIVPFNFSEPLTSVAELT